MSPRALRKVVEQRLLTDSGDYQDYGSISNPGLILSRYLIDQRAGEQERESNRLPKTGTKFLLEKVSQATTPEGYEQAFVRWQSTLKSRSDIEFHHFAVNGRMAVGIGEASVLETSLALRQPWGVPYIPGAALKGLAASYLRNVASGKDLDMKPPRPEVDDQGNPVLDKDGRPLVKPNAYSVLFGTDQSAAYVTWHDAWILASDDTQSFRMDTITTHHPGYYQNSRTNPEPSDFDDPTSIPFLSVSGTFLIALQGPTDWTNFALEVLTQALEHSGIGAKTNAGYGRLIPVHIEPVLSQEEIEEQETLLDDFVMEVLLTPDGDVGDHVGEWVSRWQSIPEGNGKLEVAKTIVQKAQNNTAVFAIKFRDPNADGNEMLRYLRSKNEVIW